MEEKQINYKLDWYKKLSKKLRLITSGKLNLFDYIEEVDKKIEDLSNSPEGGESDGWISVEQRLPENDTRVLGYSPKYGINSVWFINNEFTNAQSTTYWQPLPKSPSK